MPEETGLVTRIEQLEDALREIGKHNTEHDLDCEEGGPKDRCTPCIVAAALGEKGAE